MIDLYDYNRKIRVLLCPIGQQLRYRAVWQAACIRAEAWAREGVTPLERSNMLEQAKQASPEGYAEAWQAWREHYASCLVCQEALRS